MTKEIDIYIIFYGEMKFFDQAYWFLNQCVNSVKKLSDYPYRVHIVDNGSEKEVIEKIKQLIPGAGTDIGADVQIIINENKGAYASVMNKVIRTAMSGSGGGESDPFISIHSDMRVTKGWLNTLVQEYYHCVDKYKKPVCLMPHYLHYELEENNPFLGLRANFKSPSDMEAMCIEYDIPYSRENKDKYKINGLMSRSPYRGKKHIDKRHITDDGSNLMSFIAGKDFFNSVGLYDENFTGWGWEDNDMGVRALMAGCKVLQTHDVYVEHASGLTRGIGKDAVYGRTYDYFLEKWGKSMTDDLQSGKLWVDLHNRQS